MNLDAIGMLLITAVVGFITTIFWRWVSVVSDTSKDNTKKLEDVKSDIGLFKLHVSELYQSKADAHKDMQFIIELFKEIKADVKEIGNKMDKKADKP